MLSANLRAHALGTPQHQPPSAHPSTHPPWSKFDDQQSHPAANLPRSLVIYLHIAQPLPFLPSPSLLLPLHFLADFPLPIIAGLLPNSHPVLPPSLCGSVLSLGDVDLSLGLQVLALSDRRIVQLPPPFPQLPPPSLTMSWKLTKSKSRCLCGLLSLSPECSGSAPGDSPSLRCCPARLRRPPSFPFANPSLPVQQNLRRRT